MKNNINKKVGATLLAAAIMAGTAVIPMSNAAVEAAAKEANKPSIQYRVQVQDHAWMSWVNEGEMAGTVGESRRMETLQVRMINCEGVSLKYYAHIQDLGDCYFTDKDEYVGTVAQSKRVEAIAITSEGLKEKGYQLQYRVQVQDYGWMPWVNDGEMAGTRYESKRLETIEIKVVPIAEGTRAEYLLNLANYDVVLAEKMGEDADEYKEMEKTIATAIANINKAETDADAKAIYDVAVIEIKSVRPKIDSEVDTVLKDKATVKADAEKVLNEYMETASTIIGLDSGSAANLVLRVATAKSQVESAKSPSKITEIMNNLTAVMNLDQYKLAIAKTEAVNELNKYLTADASTGVKSKVAKAVKAAKEGTVANTIKSNAATAMAELDALKTAQEYALEQLDIYADSMSTLKPEEKTFVSERIAEVRKTVDEAETATKVTDAMTAFKNNIDTRFPAVADDAADKLNAADEANALKQAIDTNVAELRDYANTVKFWADKTAAVTNASSTEDKKGTEKAQKLAKELIESYIADINVAKSVEEIETIMNGNDEVDGAIDALNTKIASTINYDVAYDAAIKKVNSYAELANLPLEVKTYIDNTRKGLNEVTTADEVESIIASFDAYMEELGLDEELTDSTTEQDKVNALRELQKYTNSKVGTSATIAKEAIKSINEATTYSPTTYTKAMEDIVWQYKLDAYTQLVVYTDEAKYGDIEDKDGNSVADIANNYITAITDLVVEGNDYATTISTVTSKLSKAKTEIGKLTVLAEDKVNADFIKSRTEKVEEITAMKNLANSVGATDASKIANSYIGLVSGTTTQEELAQRIAEYTTDITEVVKSNAEGKNLAVYELNQIAEAIKDFDEKEKTQINAVVSKVKVAIKNMKDDDAKVNNSEKVNNELNKITAIKTAVTNVNSAKKTAIQALETAKESADTSTKKLAIDKAINDIKAIYVDVTKADDKTDAYGVTAATNRITEIKTEATK